MRKLFFVLSLAGFWPGWLPASDQQFTFALPEMEGRISLGIFDPQGGLVRTLAVSAEVAAFKIGLNGLITTWDGKDDAGTAMPAGKYVVRGFVVGEKLKAEGEAYHFNDWVENADSPRMNTIKDFARIPGGFILLTGIGRVGMAVLRSDDKGAFLWQSDLTGGYSTILWSGIKGQSLFQTNGSKPMGGDLVVSAQLSSPDIPSLVAAAKDQAVALCGPKFYVLNLSDGSTAKSETCTGPPATALAADGNEVFLASEKDLLRVRLPGLENQKKESTPTAFSALGVNATGLAGVSAQEPRIFISFGQAWEKLETGILPTSLSFGTKNTFWMTGKMGQNGDILVGQFDGKGEFLRAYRDEGFIPQKVVASTDSEEIAVLEQKGQTQRLRVLRFSEKKDEGSSDWEIIFEKSLTACRNFGVVGGKLEADAPENASNPAFKITLVTGGLTAAAPTLEVCISPGETGLWLETKEGLRLKQLTDQNGLHRIASVAGVEADSRRIYAGDGAVVAEYLVTGLSDIAEIEAGEIEIP